MRGGARKGTGGAMPGAGRKKDAVPKKTVPVRLTDAQAEMHKRLGGSRFYQDYLDAARQRQADEAKNQSEG